MNALRQLVRIPVGATTLALAAAAVAACGSAAPPAGGGAAAGAGAPSHPAATSAAARAGASPAQTVASCLTSDLKVTLDSAAAGAAAGSSYVPLEFTNASGRSCSLSGYPAVTFATTVGGPQIGTAATAEYARQSGALTLAPGGVAHAWLQIADVTSFPASQCRPVQAGGLRVALTGTQTAAFLPHSFQACANKVPGSTVLAVYPVQPGQAVRGTAP